MHGKKLVVNILATFLFAFAHNLLVLLLMIFIKIMIDIKWNEHGICHLLTRLAIAFFVLALKNFIGVKMIQILFQDKAPLV